MQTVLISGASVAAPALAYLLRRHGFAPTVVERAPAPRRGGQAIDIRGVALEVVDRMGLGDEVRRMRTRMRGMAMLDRDGNEVMRSTEMTLSSGRLDSGDVEVLRDDLTGLLYERTRDDVEYLFGDSVTALAQDERGVRVEFADARPRAFDLVVGADGLHSGVRRLVFGPEEAFLRRLGTSIAIFSADNFLGLDNWQIWLRDDTREGLGYAVYPARDNTELRITLGFPSEPADSGARDVEQWKRLLAERFAHLGWETPRVLAAMDRATDLFCDDMAQIHMERWSEGRVVLVGDAGYCPSPLSGQGTSLALVGAYTLAEELRAAEGDHRVAFARYEERMRPYVALNQALATDHQDGQVPEEELERAKNAFALHG
ncbi:2-polyprenyl-6-methoxyphenol hydroxylase [Streptoalloteichus tenebrarius]|uniref:2-polyprenyl-6-methoxyphenol hydroxylase n=1 Tax=Streptoalloteichus tenebrarius (strain ATCC 17920 / DSM 40477 / JCM 4838 / CBS 697.72 / NBRC 16177 / NCIMB 11028 / NRRL B-12390 / A12253. 1 / ISP 5477) TaxID=1933 RepID=A0ABT1HTQ2_STRSD|nr:FAD-dependent monooxygenase [Streptoalloteichus tenebrarius]MCP2258898.1 2-polyprenyl-6-methoxyphenol hydroxylase [Streptoalloteichus tenebrarius]BFE99415.1 FAD-dependent monooxygenase [Streptoalloteichus tenebrarius]